MGNDWSKDGLRHRAQGTRKLITESKNRSQGSRGKEGRSEKKIEANSTR